MSAYELIVMTAKPHANGYAADQFPDGKTWGRPSVRAWWSTHPVTNTRPPVVWPVKTEA
jgi:hypothetical protein